MFVSLIYINFKPSNSNKKKLAQNNPISQIETEQLSKVNKTLSLKVKPGHQKMGWLHSQVSMAKNLAVVESGSNSTVHFF
jgi:hypothetical protein